MSEGGLGAFLLPAMLIALLAFMFWSQRRRAKATADLQSSIQVGDDVCTTSGLFGRVTALDEIAATLEVAPGVSVRFDRRALALKVDTSGRPVTSAAGSAVTTDATDVSDASRATNGTDSDDTRK